MTDLKPYYQVKLTLLRCKTYFLNNPPKTEDEKYAYDIIEKAYWINEKKIEMLDYKKKTNNLPIFSGLSAFFRYNVYYHPKGARK